MSRPEATEAEATHRAIAIADQVNTRCAARHEQGRVWWPAKEAGCNVYGEPIAAALGTDGRQMPDKDWRHAAGTSCPRRCATTPPPRTR